MKNLLKIIFLLGVIVFYKCSKEDEFDYRDKYLGNFDFTVEVLSWHLNSSDTGDLQIVNYDTLSYLGVISKYDSIDDGTCNYFYDLYDESKNENPNEKITIEFGECKKITSLLEANGELESKSGYHYSHQGLFRHVDTIEFSINGLGGMGYGSSYDVIGIRK